MKLSKEARAYVYEMLKATPELDIEDVDALIAKYYIADKEKLVRQDIRRISNQLMAKLRDENSIRDCFVAVSGKRHRYIHIPGTTDIFALRRIIFGLQEKRNGLTASIHKIWQRVDVLEAGFKQKGKSSQV